MFLDIIIKRFGYNTPIFTQEILDLFSFYSRPRVFQLIKEAENNGRIIRYDKGIYYVPTTTEIGISSISINQVVNKKYIQNEKETFGIYGKSVIDVNFFISTLIPNTIEVITNNEARKYREITIRNRKVVLRKSRCKITSNNYPAYTILELFTSIDLGQYYRSDEIRKAISEYIDELKIKRKDIDELICYFPKKTRKKIEESGVTDEFA